MSKQQQKESVAADSVAASFLMTGGKLVVGLMTGSMGILSEAAHSLLDMGAAVITYFAVRVSDKPADEEHHYGHGKIEALSALIETALLFVTSFWIIYEASKRLLTGNIEVEATWYAFAVVIASICIDISRSRALMKVAKETKSQALEADAIHFQSDIWSSTVVLIGLVCVLFGVKGADSVAALGVAVFVMKVGYQLGKRTFDVLIDTAPEGITEIARDIITTVPGVLGIERIRTRAMGPTVSIDAIILVNRKMNTETAHELSVQIENVLTAKFPEADVLIHMKAISLSSETIVETVHILGHKHGFSVHKVIVDTQENKRFVSYDLEVPRDLTVKEAHHLATETEKIIQKEIGDDIEINTHIDPSSLYAEESKPIDEEELDKIASRIQKTAQICPKLKNIHNIRARKIGNEIILTLHCDADPEMPMIEAHEEAEKLEEAIRKNEQRIRIAVVHVEPEE